MTKFKKVLMMGASYALVATLAIGGTLAYLQSEDSDVNVMTLGNVEIEQVEQERDENGNLDEFHPNKPAYPAVGPVEWDDEKLEVNDGEYKVFTDELKNVVDKIVTVKNTGKFDAYIRTVIAIEAPEYDKNDLIHINYNFTVRNQGHHKTLPVKPLNASPEGSLRPWLLSHFVPNLHVSFVHVPEPPRGSQTQT